jgi:DNA-binding MarR family transcriptional regulator
MYAVAPDRYGFELPLLLAGGFRTLVDALHTELAKRGHADARPIHGFALQALGPDGATPTELGRRLGVTKQAATKTAASLERLGYLIRQPHPTDARAVVLRRSARGDQFLATSAEIFEELHARWAQQVGMRRLRALEDDLERIVTAHGTKLADLPGWLR